MVDDSIKVEVDYKPKDAPVCRITITGRNFKESSIEQILELLKTSAAPNNKWLEVAFAYLKLNNIEDFKRILHGCIDINKKKGKSGRTAIIYLYNILIGYFMGRYLAEGNSAEKEKLRSQFLSEINSSDEYTRDVPMIVVKKGFATLAENNLTYAKVLFDYAVEKDSKQILSLFGKACFAYYQHSYNEALKLFQNIFKINPNTDLNIRQCIGLCFYKLEDYKKAHRAFTRCLELNPNNDSCLVYLGIISLKESNSNTQIALDLFEQAYKLNPNNPLCLIQLANHYFLVGNFPKTEMLAERALNILNCYKIVKSAQKSIQSDNSAIVFDIDEMRAELHFLLGKVAHCKENYGRALKCYKETLEEDNQHHAAAFCLAQIHIQMNQFAEAEKLLFKLRDMNQYRADPEIGRLLGFCQVKLNKRKEAITKYEEVISFITDDIETLIQIAELLEIEDPTKALTYYTQAMNLLRKANTELHKIQIELLNNIGIANTLIGNLIEAKKNLKEALIKLHEELKTNKDIKRASLEVTLQFNLGYLYEMQGSFGEASSCYKKIIKYNPGYVDSYMRLAILAMRRGDHVRALNYANIAKKNLVEKKSHVCNCFIGTIYAQLGETKRASDIFDYVSESTGKGWV